MSKTREFVVLFVTLLIFWVLLNNSIASDVLMVGAVAATVIALVFHQGLVLFSEFRFTPKAILTVPIFVLFFLKELVKSNLNVATIVLSPQLPLKPGIVKVRTRLKTRMGRLLLANSITLTPGTLTVDVVGEWLYIHWVNVESADIDEATTAIVSGFERYLEVMYG
ncbi:Na+/H+ antiporter subunit E [Rhodoferax sp.]|uniref:Na+/H+ antiporter subunit E n=1 Tax=Rhodoferax sp. TaxID=50421 RepID=UPI002841FA4E|nr:Na+/H+ antiporter subunit E [Rhodoferax sp.]MDR3369894.1 Na+/H+ antiporter subunit E [Rhodoferax sp.]